MQTHNRIINMNTASPATAMGMMMRMTPGRA